MAKRINIDTAVLLADHKRGMSVAAIGRKYNVSEGMVRHRLRSCNTREIQDGELRKDPDGAYILLCEKCGKERRWKSLPPKIQRSRLCNKCATAFYGGRGHPWHRDDINSGVLVQEYKAGASLTDLGVKYGMTAAGIRNRILKTGGKTRDLRESQKNHYGRKAGCGSADEYKLKTDAHIRITTSPEYKAWREKILGRDESACVMCGSRQKLQAHHLKPRTAHPELTFDLANGITLCKPCHRKIRGREQEWESKFKNLLWLRGWAVGMAALYLDSNRRDLKDGRREARLDL